MKISEEEACSLVSSLAGKEITHVWRGHGSAIFLELGELSAASNRKNPRGEQCIMIEWSWRFEDENRILLGSWSESDQIDRICHQLLGREVTRVSFFSRIREIEVSLSGGYWLLSFATSEGGSEWSIKLNQRDWVSFQDGTFVVES